MSQADFTELPSDLLHVYKCMFVQNVQAIHVGRLDTSIIDYKHVREVNPD